MVQGHDGTPFAPPRARGLTRAPRAAQELLEGCARVPWSGDPRLALGRHCIDQDVRQLLDRNLRAEGVARKRRRDLALDGRRSRKAWRGIDGRLQVEPPFCPCTWPTQENMRRPPRLARKARRRVPERRNSSGAPSPYWIYTRPRCARAHAIGLLMPSRPGIGAYSAPYLPRPWRECVCISDDSPKCPRACLANACMRPRRARTLPKPQPDALCCPDGALSL